MKHDKRILVWGLSNNKAGTEKVIETYCKQLPELNFDFLCYESPTNYPGLIKRNGNRYFTIPIKIKHPLDNRIKLNRFCNEHRGEYSTLWMNINDISNLDLLKFAEGKLDIPRRIVHMHNAGIPNNLITKLFSKLNRPSLFKYSTDFWACSQSAGQFLFGDNTYKVVPNLIDDNKVAFDKSKRKVLRKKLGIKEDQLLIGTVGRLEEQKNPFYLLNCFNQLVQNNPEARLIYIGDGVLRNELNQKIESLSLTGKVILAGSQTDMQSFYSSLDVAVYPSLYEGLSLSILESQFNGLPCILSSSISEECCISDNTVFLPLESELWTKSIMSAKRSNTRLNGSADKFRLVNARQIAKDLFN